MIPKKSPKFLVILSFLLVVMVALWGYTEITGGATVENVTVEVTMTEERSLPRGTPGEGPDAYVCEFSGALPGQFQVTVEGTVDDVRYPWRDRYKRSDSYKIAVRLGENTGTSMTDVTVEDGGSEEFFKILSVGGDDSIESGDEATVSVLLKRGGEMHDSVTRKVTVKKREFECEGG